MIWLLSLGSRRQRTVNDSIFNDNRAVFPVFWILDGYFSKTNPVSELKYGVYVLSIYQSNVLIYLTDIVK